MKIFISWSGEPSRAVASFLRGWLPYLIQAVEPWMSDSDLEAGTRWSEKIQKELSETKFGIVCVTPGNMDAPWLLFESGALAKTLNDSHVCPYLVGLDSAQLKGPLAQFHAKTAQREGTLALVRTINRALEAKALPPEFIDTVFDRFWPDLEAKLNSLPGPKEEFIRRTAEDILEEVLLLVRSIDKRTHSRLSSQTDIDSDTAWLLSDSSNLYRYFESLADREQIVSFYKHLRNRLAAMPRENSATETKEDPDK